MGKAVVGWVGALAGGVGFEAVGTASASVVGYTGAGSRVAGSSSDASPDAGRWWRIFGTGVLKAGNPTAGVPRTGSGG
jgi:hypothetical protein